ncbi:hypothetical protein OEZ86_005737 [Tetradesmus obliquus]|nr:hypothetical protein OEZ86_005737 [Tetradesmus obliquus]
MAPRMLMLLPCIFCLAFVVLEASAQDTNHHRPRDPPLGTLSKYNERTKTYEPVTSDSRYWYYRICIYLNETFTDAFVPDLGQPTLIQTVISGDVFDNSTRVKIGQFDSQAISTVVDANLKLQYLTTMAIEMGPNGDDTLITNSALDGENLIARVVDFDLAIAGGTGRYKGAKGDVAHLGTQATKPDNLYIGEMAVPKFKRF